MTPPIKPDLSATQYADRVAERLKEKLPPQRTSRPSATIFLGAVKSFGEAFVHVLVGAVFMAGGIWLIAYAIQHPLTVTVNGAAVQTYNKLFLYGGGGATLFGALLMPTILPVVKQIVVVVIDLGQQVPVVGSLFGRRSTDGAKPPKPESPE